MALYHLHEMQHAALFPTRVVMQSVRAALTNPWFPLSHTYVGRRTAALADVFEQTTRRYTRPDFSLPITTIDGHKSAVHEIDVFKLPFCALRHFYRDAAPKTDPVILLVAPLSGHYSTLLRGTVEALLPKHSVYITDWVNAREVSLKCGNFTVADYVNYMRAFMSFLGPRTHIIAVCQPSVPVLAAVSLMAEDNDPNRPASMTLMGGPIDTRKSPTEVNRFAEEHDMEWFERRVIDVVPVQYRGRGRSVYPGFMQLSGFLSMNIDRHVGAYIRYYGHLIKGDGDSAEKHRKFYEEYLAVMDLPAEFYLETIRWVFKEHSLAKGQLYIDGRKVDPAAISDVALLTVEGERDDITGTGQTAAAHDLCRNLPASMRQHHLHPKVGHYGIFNGFRWREEILPCVAAFMRSHNTRG